MLLDGKKFVVAGGATGIGAATVKAYVNEGARVVCLDTNCGAGEQVAEVLGSAARFLPCDVTNQDMVIAAVAEAANWLGGIDGVVDVAGIQELASAADLTAAQWDRTFDVHARGTFFVNQAAFGYLKESGSGRIINTGSSAAVTGGITGPGGGNAHYAAAKGAIMAWTRAIAREWGPLGITANTVVPAIWTPMYERLRDSMTPQNLQKHDDQVRLQNPVSGRLGDADADFAPVMVFLASDMSHYITGQVLAVNGGMLMFG